MRLKLHCVPPTLNYDRAHANGGHLAGLERVLDFDNSSGSGEDDYHTQPGLTQYYDAMSNPQGMQPRQGSFNSNVGAFHTPPYSDSAPSLNEYPYDEVPAIAMGPEQPYQEHLNYPQVNGNAMSNGATWNNEQVSASELSDVLGELKISENGIGAFKRTSSHPIFRREGTNDQQRPISQARRKAWPKLQL